MKTKEIILLIFIILAGVIFYHAYTGKINVDFDWGEGFFFTYDEFVYEDSQQITPPFPPEIQVINAHGDVVVQGTDEEKITVSFQEKIWRRKEEQAEKVSKDLRMLVKKDEQTLMISTNRDEFKRKNFETHFKISVPAGMRAKIKSSYGRVKALGVGKTDIDNRHGDVIALDINGDLKIENSYEDVEVENVQASCHIESRYSDVTVNNVKGMTKIINRHGTIHAENISKEITIECPHTSVSGRNLNGPVEIDSSYEKIVLHDADSVIIRGNHSPVEVSGAKEYVNITDSYSRVDLNNIQGNIKIDGRKLTVAGRSIIGDEISISSSYEDIDLTEFSGKTSISLSHGKLQLSPAPLTHPIEVKSQYTDIVLYWPSGEKYPVEAQVKGGDIQWNLPFDLSFQEENSMSIIKAFVQEIGKSSIFLSSTYGTIRIEEQLRR